MNKGETLHAFRISEREGQALHGTGAGCRLFRQRSPNFRERWMLAKKAFSLIMTPTAPSAFSINPL